MTLNDLSMKEAMENNKQEAGPRHTHRHVHEHEHEHEHGHEHEHAHKPFHDHDHPHAASGGITLVIRPVSGLSGDMMLAGLARMADLDQAGLAAFLDGIAIPLIGKAVELVPHAVNAVFGWKCAVNLPHEHVHRTLADIRRIIEGSALSPRAAELAESTFTLLAEAEGRVHGMPAEAVTFHEVGALDSILDICLSSALFDLLSPARLVCGPLPLCDGAIRCSHGIVPAPAPAVLEMLEGVPVRGIPSDGETVTPTAIALLKGFGAIFGPWPAMTVERRALVYGTRVLPDVANGAIFTLGPARGT